MPTQIEWHESDDPDDPPGTRVGRVVYSSNPRAVANRERRRRLGLRHTTHAAEMGEVCRVCGSPWPCPTPWKQATIPWGPNHPWGKPDPGALQAARGFIADWLRHEDYFGTEASLDWFGDLADFVAAIPLDAHLIRAIARFIEPLLGDDEGRIEAVLYPNGSAVAYVETTTWGGDLGAYLDGSVEALGRDFAAWKGMVRDVGPAARWPAAGLDTGSPAKLLKGRR